MTASTQKVHIVAFRVDASLEIGTGHVMRCLTVAKTLQSAGAQCYFLSREHLGHLCDLIEEHGFFTYRLPTPGLTDRATTSGREGPTHARWLGTTWEQDAVHCRSILTELSPDWLVVDHYALDVRWEAAVLPLQSRLFIIDDLADRPHCADLLLDQNLGRRAADYSRLLMKDCQLLVGPAFALLRSEFSELRKFSLARRNRETRLKRLLITMGGVDKDNVTGLVIDALKFCKLPDDIEITVVLGATAPWLKEVNASADQLPWSINVVSNVPDMARRMAEADLAIGAAGSTSWERCCLGLPTLMLVLAENQRPIARALNAAGAAISLSTTDRLFYELPDCLYKVQAPGVLSKMSSLSAKLTDGEGVKKLFHIMQQENSLT
ncbi:UDP-2,4-diacetamido-2,4,6-trideoxy-beta-L-altropyranose hydrolase [Halomonas sp. H10-59]|uniref:UDP-2,4-diacetamido-2,4, 6-trideoxy-beta-L-altropyranose hydrolase n=1 Tax=Halomonas sp. H10-59 TaxID=2950874 RepID=A0AAU7KZ34_9GAMM